MGFRSKRTFRLCLRAAGETETRQEDIQEWLELDEAGLAFQLLTGGKKCCSEIFYIYFYQHYMYY
jgi:hypothetical protein